jgi:hypothetical protein
MTTKTFSTLYVSNLRIDDLYSLNKSTIEYATPVKESIGDLPAATLVRLETNNKALGEQMNKALKSALTRPLVGSDANRDNRFSEIKRHISTHIKGRDETKKAAAEALEAFLSSYWDTNKKAMNTETGVFSEMLAKYKADETLKANAATIGITDMMTGLEEANTAFNTLYQTRNTEESQAGPSASSLKSAAVDSYQQFCMAIEQSVNFAVSDTLTTLFNQMDELRKKYAVLVNRKDEEEEAGAKPDSEIESPSH